MGYGIPLETAFDSFSMARGLVGFAKDIRKHPKEIAEAADSLVEGYLFFREGSVQQYWAYRALTWPCIVPPTILSLRIPSGNSPSRP